MKVLTKLRFALEHAAGRYEVDSVRDDAIRTRVLSIVEQVRHQELNRRDGPDPLESAAFAGERVEDTLFACRDVFTDRYVGCVRATDAGELVAIPESRVEYCLDEIPEPILRHTGIATRLTVLPDYRRTGVGFALMQAMYAEGLRRGYLLCVLSCEPGLYPMYARMGFRPLGRVRSNAKGGFRVPMVLVNHDADHLCALASPLLKTLAKHDAPHPRSGVDWYAQRSRSVAFSVGAHPYDDPKIDSPLLSGMSSRGKRTLFTNGVALDCELGQRIVNADDGSSSLGFVERGAVRVERPDGEVLLELGRGDVFGEIACVLESRRAVNVVVSGEGTRVVMLSRRALKRVTGPDATTLWQNLARILGRRMVQTMARDEERRS